MPNENKISLCESCKNCLITKSISDLAAKPVKSLYCTIINDYEQDIVTECTHYKEKDNGEKR